MIRLLRGVNNLPASWKGCVATIGNFDGLHRGHQQLIKQLKQKSLQLQLPSLIITFEPQPNEFFNATPPARLTRLREKLWILQQLGVDYVLCLRFDQRVATLSSAEFVQKFFIAALDVHYILVGDDFHFGAKREGTLQALKNFAHQFGFEVESMPTYIVEQRRVSSSRVRLALTQGDLKTAHDLLGRWYGIAGRVAHGAQRGRMIGFPTANIFLHRQQVALQGVYVVKVHGLNAGGLQGVANVGNRPTVDGTRSLLEVHLFDFSQDIYGKTIYVEFLHKLRDERKFATFELLRQQILNDAEAARRYFD